MSIKEWMTRVMEKFKDLSTDYVIEQGTSNSWNYTKWNSGRMEAVIHMTNATYDSYATINGLRRSLLNNLPTLPAFTSIEYVNAGGANSGAWPVATFSGLAVSVWNYVVSGTVVCNNISVEVKGRWKSGGVVKALFSRLSAIFARGWQYVFKGITGPNHKCFKSRLYSGARHERNLDISKVEQWHCGMLGSLERVSEFYPFLGRDVYMRLNECKFPGRPIHCDSVCHVFKFRRRFSRSVQRWFGYSVSSSYPTRARFKRKRRNFQRADCSKRALEIVSERGCFA